MEKPVVHPIYDTLFVSTSWCDYLISTMDGDLDLLYSAFSVTVAFPEVAPAI